MIQTFVQLFRHKVDANLMIILKFHLDRLHYHQQQTMDYTMLTCQLDHLSIQQARIIFNQAEINRCITNRWIRIQFNYNTIINLNTGRMKTDYI